MNLSRTSTRSLSRSFGLLAVLSAFTAHAAAIGWSVAAISHATVAVLLYAQSGEVVQPARLSGGKVSHSVEIILSMPPAPPSAPVIETPVIETPVIETIVEEPTPAVAAGSRHPTPDHSMPLPEAVEVARASEARPTAPQRSVAMASRERFAHAPRTELELQRPPSTTDPLTSHEPVPRKHPRREPTHRPPAPEAVVSVPSTLGSEVDQMAQPIYNPPPAYPAAALASGTQGRVMLRLTITDRGNVTRVTVATSSGSTLLDQAALTAVEKWRFQPALRGDAPVEWSCQLPIRFRLD